jgi:hypothetical protein
MKRLMVMIVGPMLMVAMLSTVHAQSLDDTTMKFLKAGSAAIDASNAAPTAELHREYGETALADYLAGCEQAESTGHVESNITALCATARAKVDAASPEDRNEIQERALRLRMSTLQ